MAEDDVAPGAETGFSHRLTAFFGLSYLNISGNNQVKNFFLESVTFQFHAHILSSEVVQSLKSNGIFSELGAEIALSHRHVEFFSGKANASIHGLGEDDTAKNDGGFIVCMMRGHQS